MNIFKYFKKIPRFDSFNVSNHILILGITYFNRCYKIFGFLDRFYSQFSLYIRNYNITIFSWYQILSIRNRIIIFDQFMWKCLMDCIFWIFCCWSKLTIFRLDYILKSPILYVILKEYHKQSEIKKTKILILSNNILKVDLNLAKLSSIIYHSNTNRTRN